MGFIAYVFNMAAVYLIALILFGIPFAWEVWTNKTLLYVIIGVIIVVFLRRR